MRNIDLKRGSVAKYDDGSPFLVESGALELRFRLPDPNGDYFVVSQTSIAEDGRKRLPIARDGKAALHVSVGELRLAVKRYIGGRLVESYGVEPLDVRSVDGTVTAFPELSALQRQAAGLEKTMQEEREARTQACAEALKAMEQNTDKAMSGVRKDALNAVHKLAVAFLRYSYTDYRRNIYVNTRNASFEQFLSAFGFSEKDFTAEELAAIKEEAKI